MSPAEVLGMFQAQFEPKKEALRASWANLQDMKDKLELASFKAENGFENLINKYNELIPRYWGNDINRLQVLANLWAIDGENGMGLDTFLEQSMKMYSTGFKKVLPELRLQFGAGAKPSWEQIRDRTRTYILRGGSMVPPGDLEVVGFPINSLCGSSVLTSYENFLAFLNSKALELVAYVQKQKETGGALNIYGITPYSSDQGEDWLIVAGEWPGTPQRESQVHDPKRYDIFISELPKLVVELAPYFWAVLIPLCQCQELAFKLQGFTAGFDAEKESMTAFLESWKARLTEAGISTPDIESILNSFKAKAGAVEAKTQARFGKSNTLIWVAAAAAAAAFLGS